MTLNNGQPIRIAVLMTCHNRRDATIKSLQGLKAQQCTGVHVELFLVDDGSTDGTSEAVRQVFPSANTIRGDGNLYWCGGMRLAFASAMQGNFDFYLWLNDDVVLMHDALSRLIATYVELSRPELEALIVVGSMRDPVSGVFTYGGWRKRRGKLGTPSWEKQPPATEHAVYCETFNGNCVLVSREVARRNGNLDPAFTQIMGDLDYGLRAIANGCKIVIAAGYIGECKENPGDGQWTDERLPVRTRWNALLGPKGLPIGEWRVFCRRHKGVLWPLVWLSPYVRFWTGAIGTRKGVAR